MTGVQTCALPISGQPAILLHDKAAARADQLGIASIAVSISHERDFAVAVAYAVRTAGGRYIFPPDVEEDLDARERAIRSRIADLRALYEESRRLEDVMERGA